MQTSFSSMSFSSEETIRNVLEKSRTIALIGASKKKERPSNEVLHFLIQSGYTVFPVNPGFAGDELYGRTVYASLKDIPEPVDMVDIFRASDAVGPIVDDAIETGAKSIWMQIGVINENAASKAKEAGLDVIIHIF